MRPLIDTTEMYLRTVLELEEEGIPPLRARLVERLSQSGPTVSETVARLEADGLLHLVDGRRLELTTRGREVATSVMRKHRLAELLLVEVIGLDWEQVHNEACRWEHVISDRVEERLVTLLGAPAVCPHGNPIPGLGVAARQEADLVTVAEAARRGAEVVVERISEWLQVDEGALALLRRAGLVPGARVALRLVEGAVLASVPGASGPEVELGPEVGAHVFVRVCGEPAGLPGG